MTWMQKNLRIEAKRRGFHIITNKILAALPELNDYKVGMLNVFLQHSSAALTINENADPSVRTDFETYFTDSVSEDHPGFIHTYEGPDDMPAHLKSSILGVSLNIPIQNGHLALGTWQGIYLCEHRNHASSRHLVLTLQGEKA